ncbi:MAG: FmdB family transcriptional regulator [Candidatus Omnitrophica bacterium]|nr:FmdB family transcriptional regulator [Candidatus Omnitrophota bacterium]
MPTYTYECLKCGRTFEIFQQMTAPHLKECEKCHGELRRLIGPGGGFIFKGSGGSNSASTSSSACSGCTTRTCSTCRK